jgi:ABC-2 type transport system ATP-binding protein
VELRIEGLSKRYGNGIQALKDVTLTVRPGLFGLLGPNGAGKSTLMRTLAGLQEADAGKVTLRGGSDGSVGRGGEAPLIDIDVLAEPDRVRRVLGYLPQEFGLYPKVPAEELLDHLARLKGIADGKERKATVEALLQKTNLWEARKRRLGTFSGGMKQRFGIAQALLGNPRLMIVDEPTAGLDPEERVRFHNLLAEISESVVVLLSTHIVDDVADLCQQMAIIHEGRVVGSGDPLALVAELRGRVWQRVLAAQEALDPALEVLSRRRLAGKTVVHVHAGGAPDGFGPVEPDLEDVYFRAIRSTRAA